MVLGLVTAIVLISHPHWRNMPYALISLCQGSNLLAIGVETLPGLGLPQAYAQHGLLARTAFDLCSAAAMVHSVDTAALAPALRPLDRLAAWSACAPLWLWRRARRWRWPGGGPRPACSAAAC